VEQGIAADALLSLVNEGFDSWVSNPVEERQSAHSGDQRADQGCAEVILRLDQVIPVPSCQWKHPAGVPQIENVLAHAVEQAVPAIRSAYVSKSARNLERLPRTTAFVGLYQPIDAMTALRQFPEENRFGSGPERREPVPRHEEDTQGATRLSVALIIPACHARALHCPY